MIVTLAGHVDHGKTSLVHALTGVNTDRLEEEKKRGLTIDLGFAYIDEGKIGFVDVPGHHKFIHNMVAGVASEQFALLVIAADDGPMPQSREHLSILSLVGIKRGAIALTKCDRVDEARIKRCLDEITALTQGTFLHQAQVFRTSTEQTDSFNPLLEKLRSEANESKIKQTNTAFRLAIDRAFSIRGAGLVVTGTVHSGQLALDDTLFHFPSGKTVRVRDIRCQNQTASSASGGERCALNITGLSLDEVKRGDWLSAYDTAHYSELSVKIDVLKDFPRPVKHWTPVHIYHATSHSTGRLALLSEDKIEPAHSAAVDLICDLPLAVRAGDRLVIRDHSLDLTLGGGTVIHTRRQGTQRRRADTHKTLLQNYDQPTATQSCRTLLDAGYFHIQPFLDTWQISQQTLSELLQQHQATQLDQLAISKTYIASVAKEILARLESEAKSNASSTGLKENAFGDVPPVLRTHILNALAQSGRIKNAGGTYSLASHTADLPEALQQIWQRLEQSLNVKQAPSSGDLAKQWQMQQSQLETSMQELVKRGLLVRVAKHRFYLPAQLQILAQEVKQLAATKPFSVKEFRDLTGIGRNIAIEILEYFDGRGFTRRQNNERVVLRDSYELKR